MALLAAATGQPCTLVHVDHGLRMHSAHDRELIVALADRLGATVEFHTVSVGAGSNVEARARIARHQVLRGAATGHTADDRAESVLINLIRGAGATGLSTLRPGPQHPILDLRRSETHALCAAAGVAVLDDPMNADPRFVRNRLRHEVLPLLDTIAQRSVAPLLVRTANLLSDDDALLDDLSAAAVPDPTDARAVAGAPLPLARRALRKWLSRDGYAPSARELERVLEVARGTVVACELSGGRRVARRNQRLSIEPS
jgi:tRNA(Ile)-lysidine synthase